MRSKTGRAADTAASKRYLSKQVTPLATSQAHIAGLTKSQCYYRKNNQNLQIRLCRKKSFHAGAYLTPLRPGEAAPQTAKSEDADERRKSG